MLCLLKSVAVWVALAFVGARFRGMLRRPCMIPRAPPVELGHEQAARVLQDAAASVRSRHALLVAIWVGVTPVYLAALYHWGNVLLAVAGAVAMVTNLPDCRFGRLPRQGPIREERLDALLYGASVLVTGGNVVLVWYALCRWGAGS